MWYFTCGCLQSFRLPDNDNRYQQKVTSTSYQRLWSSLIYYYHFSNIWNFFPFFCVCEGKSGEILLKLPGVLREARYIVRLMKLTICFQFTFDCTNIVKNWKWTSEGKINWKALSMCWEPMWSVSIGSSAPTIRALKSPWIKDPTDDYKRMISPEHGTVLKVASNRED